MAQTVSPTPQPAREADGPTLVEGLVVLSVLATAGVAAWMLYGPMIGFMLRELVKQCALGLGLR